MEAENKSVGFVNSKHLLFLLLGEFVTQEKIGYVRRSLNPYDDVPPL